MRDSLTVAIAAILLAGPSASSAQTVFTDVTEEAGVGDTGFGVGAAWGDLNNDGHLDLYLVNLGQSNKLYLNAGDEAFQDITGESGVGDTGDGVGCAWADYDSDGWLDLTFTNRPGPDRLYRNLGDSTFVDMAPSFGMDDPSGLGESAAWADYDNDGYVDLYKVRMQQPNILYRNISGEDFEDATSHAGVGNAGPGEGAAWCDYDDDGDSDLFVTNASGTNLLYRNNGDGTFTDVTESAGLSIFGHSYGCAWADYDNDGDFDLYVGRSEPNKLYQNRGDGTFDDLSDIAGVGSASWTLGIAWGDYDNDGWIDLHLAVHEGDDLLYRNLGDGTFADVTDEAGVHNPHDGRGNTWGDFNSDGFLDLYVVNHAGARNVLFANNGNENHFLYLVLTGTFSNADGIGSKVVCVCDNWGMTRQVEGGSGFASQNSLPVEFGMGNDLVVDSLIVYWPSGIVDTLTNLAVDRTYNLTEGGSVDVAEEYLPSQSRGVVLYPSHPNPFTASTIIRYDLPRSGLVDLGIYDLQGRRVRTLVESSQEAGSWIATWNPVLLAAGTYFCRLGCGSQVRVRKLSYLPGSPR